MPSRFAVGKHREDLSAVGGFEGSRSVGDGGSVGVCKGGREREKGGEWVGIGGLTVLVVVRYGEGIERECCWKRF